MEVSSQALAMHRVDGLLFDLAVLTNLKQDHLDYHKTLKAYQRAKFMLFEKLKEKGTAIFESGRPGDAALAESAAPAGVYLWPGQRQFPDSSGRGKRWIRSRLISTATVLKRRWPGRSTCAT